MSYDLRFAVKAENGQFVEFATPEYDHPTYNLGDMFRAATGWNYKQGEYYRVSEIKHFLMKGVYELTFNRKAYEQYVPDNGWGSIRGAIECLESVLQKIVEIQDWYDLPLDIIYLAW